MLTRLLDNLPAVARQDPAYSRVVCAMGPRGVQRYVTQLLSYGIFDWAVSASDLQAILDILAHLSEGDKASLIAALDPSDTVAIADQAMKNWPAPAPSYRLSRILFDAVPNNEVDMLSALLGWRFDIEVKALTESAKYEGDVWSKPGLTRCWDVFEALPPEHVRDNQNFSHLLRYVMDKTEGYASDFDEVNAIGYSNDADIDNQTESGDFADPGDPMYGKNIFDATVRHEVGHLVDRMYGGAGYCETEPGGAWEDHGSGGGLASLMVEMSNGPIAAIADDAERELYVSVLQGAIDLGEPDAIKDNLFSAVMAGRQPEDMKGSELKQAVATIEALQSDDATEALIVAFEKKGPWNTATGGIALDGRIFQEGYAGEWNSYAADARTRKVSRYQFRTAAEWFAEAYAAYYQPPGPKGTVLAAADPATKRWFDANVDPKGGAGCTEQAAEPEPAPEGGG
jgi:hypothetical protein